MKTLKNNWKTLTKPFTNNLNEALQQQHHAAQFIALVGKHLIPQESDDSNTNMEFIPETGMIIGNSLPNGMRVALHLSEMELNILDQNNDVKKTITLEGKTKQIVFDELAQNLADVGVNISNIKNELHYEIPTHQLDKGAVFTMENKNDFIENANYRENAKNVLNEVAELLDQDELIRIWPHHFDTGAFYVVGKNDKGEASQTIGIGLAIPDSMVDEPYYYLSFWSEKPIAAIKDIAALDAGKWMIPDWNGAVLKHSEIIKVESANQQRDLVLSFFNSGINIIMSNLKG